MLKYQTNQQKVLLNYLSSHHDSLLSISQIASDLKKDGISLSSIYRYISTFESEGKVKRFSKIGDRNIMYQYVGNDDCKGHIHLSCVKCGKSTHLDTSEAKTFINSISKSNNFIINAENTVIYGICKNCK